MIVNSFKFKPALGIKGIVTESWVQFLKKTLVILSSPFTTSGLLVFLHLVSVKWMKMVLIQARQFSDPTQAGILFEIQILAFPE